MTKANDRISKRWTSALIWAVLIWLLVGSILSVALSGGAWIAIPYFLAFAAASFLDLWVLGMAMKAVLGWIEEVDSPAEKRTALAVQAFVWGLFKLACLGILGWILIVLQGSPTASLVFGLGTLVVVSLLGGWIWSQRVVRHA